MKKASFQPVTSRASQSVQKRAIEKAQVIKTDLDDGVCAEANIDGTIFVDKKLSPAKVKDAVKHEKQHLKQMQNGDLAYDSQNVYWRGKIYNRESMDEGARELPWEKEAYNGKL